MLAIRLIESVEDPWYEKQCQVCYKPIRTTRVIVAFCHEGMSTPTSFAHKACLLSVLRTGPEDGPTQFEKYREKVREGKLSAWLAEGVP